MGEDVGEDGAPVAVPVGVARLGAAWIKLLRHVSRGTAAIGGGDLLDAEDGRGRVAHVPHVVGGHVHLHLLAGVGVHARAGPLAVLLEHHRAVRVAGVGQADVDVVRGDHPVGHLCGVTLADGCLGGPVQAHEALPHRHLVQGARLHQGPQAGREDGGSLFGVGGGVGAPLLHRHIGRGGVGDVELGEDRLEWVGGEVHRPHKVRRNLGGQRLLDGLLHIHAVHPAQEARPEGLFFHALPVGGTDVGGEEGGCGHRLTSGGCSGGHGGRSQWQATPRQCTPPRRRRACGDRWCRTSCGGSAGGAHRMRGPGSGPRRRRC